MKQEFYNKLEELSKLNKKIENNNYNHQFLHKIKTTSFRNFKADSEIEFKSPITAIVGKNGTGKTTLLHLAGCSYAPLPKEGKQTKGKSFNQFIPESQKDRMEEESKYGFCYKNNSEMENNFVWYSKRHEWDRRGHKKRAERNILFIGFAKTIANVSVFSNYFELNEKAIAERLNNIGLSTEPLNPNAIKIISDIVGKEYSSIERRNDKYSELCENCQGYVIDGQYSDFACGAGEIGIIRIIDLIYNAPEESLIIIDEPEVAIHPSVQYKLLDFFIKMTLGKKIQIIFTTHSYFILKHLNPESIILLDKDDDKIVGHNVNSTLAFDNIANQNIYKLEAFVEDYMAAEMLEIIFQNNVSIRDQIKITKAISDGWVALIQKEMPLRFYNWKKYNQRELAPVLVLDGDVRDKIDITQLINHYGNAERLKYEFKTNGVDKTIKTIGKYFSLKNSVIHFKSSFYKEKDCDLAIMISDYIGHLSLHHQFLPGELSPESIIYNWIRVKIREKDITDIQVYLKSEYKSSFQDIFRNELPKRQTSDYSKDALHKLSQKALIPDIFIKSLILQYVSDKRNSEYIDTILNDFKHLLETIRI